MDTPNLKSVRPDGDRRVVVTWNDGAESTIDVSKHIVDYVVFAPLRKDDELFRSVVVGAWGWCIHWSDEMEIPADTLWRIALAQNSA